MNGFPRMAIISAILAIGCGKKSPTLTETPEHNGTANNDSTMNACVLDSDCVRGECRDGQCHQVTATNGPNGRVNNESTGPTTNNGTNGGPLNNGTIAPQMPCEDTGGAERFALAEDTGIDLEVVPSGTLEGAGGILTSGVAIADLDHDGDADVIVTNEGGAPGYFANEGDGSFVDVTTERGLGGLTATTSLTVGDIDGDADSDLVIGRIGGLYVMTNDGDGQFSDATEQWGVADSMDVVSAGVLADFDGDLDLDLYVANYSGDPSVVPEVLPNRLYRNDGQTFTELTTSPGGEGAEGSTLAAAWWDFDEDGRPDVWVANDFGMTATPNQLWRNVGPDPSDPDNWLFENIASDANVDVPIFSMSVALADFDNDGDRDGYVANMAQNVLHVVDGLTTTDESVARGVASSVLPDPRPRPVDPPWYVPFLPEMEPFLAEYTDPDSGMYTLTSWSSVFFDANQDGWQDLFVSNGAVLTPLTPEATNQPNYLFVNQRDGTFAREPCYAIPDVRGSTRGAAVGDLDGDGDQDVVWSDNGINGEGTPVVAFNEMATGNWLTIELEGASPNTDAIGARVTLSVDGVRQTRWIDGGQSYLSVSERVAHFGLGTADSVDSVVVTWPDGEEQSVDVPDVNRRVSVSQGE
jgi:hypothetical protein